MYPLLFVIALYNIVHCGPCSHLRLKKSTVLSKPARTPCSADYVLYKRHSDFLSLLGTAPQQNVIWVVMHGNAEARQSRHGWGLLKADLLSMSWFYSLRQSVKTNHVMQLFNLDCILLLPFGLVSNILRNQLAEHSLIYLVCAKTHWEAL